MKKSKAKYVSYQVASTKEVKYGLAVLTTN